MVCKKAAFRKEQPFCFSFLYLKLNLLFPFPFPESCCKRDAAELSQDKGAPYQIQVSKSFEKKCKHQRQNRLACHGYVHTFFSKGKSLQRRLIDQAWNRKQIATDRMRSAGTPMRIRLSEASYCMYGNKKQEDICQNRFGKDLPVLFSETFQKHYFCCSIRFSSGRTRISMVIKQRLPPITFDTGSARKTPSVPMWSTYGIR